MKYTMKRVGAFFLALFLAIGVISAGSSTVKAGDIPHAPLSLPEATVGKLYGPESKTFGDTQGSHGVVIKQEFRNQVIAAFQAYGLTATFTDVPNSTDANNKVIFTVEGTPTKEGSIQVPMLTRDKVGNKVIFDISLNITKEATMGLVKKWKAPAGVARPAADFVFTFTPKSFEGGEVSEMPAISGVTLSYTAGSTEEKKASGNLVPTFTKPGVYTYTVSETGFYTPQTTAGYKETVANATEMYEVQFVVETVGGALKVTKVTAHKLDGNGKPVGEKLDPSAGENSGVVFTNTYNKDLVVPNDPDNPGKPDPDKLNNAFMVAKYVSGSGAVTSDYFAFALKLTAPDGLIGTAPTSATAYIYDKSTKAVIKDLAANGITGANADGSFSVPYGSDFTFKLKDKQILFFKALPAGTIVNKAEETDKLGYMATSKYVFANGTAKDALDSANLPVLTQNGNSLVVTNKKDVTVPTGVFYDHLPLVALIVVSGVAIGAYGLLRKRSRYTK